MTLRAKTLFIISVTLVGLIIILYAISVAVLMSGFAQMEEQESRQNVQRALDALANNLAELSSVTRDYASWDDTYTFVQDANELYPKVNLADATFSNLGLNLMVFVHSSGRIVFSKAFDLQNKQQVSLPDGLAAHVSAGALLLQHPDLEGGLTGLVLLPEGPLLVASRPILTSEYQGPVRGTLIMARYLNAEQIERLSQVTHLSLTVQRFDDKQSPTELLAARSSLSKQIPILVRPMDADQTAGYALLSDIYGQPALVLRVDMPRTIYQQGQLSQHYLVASLIIVGLAFVVVVWLLLERLVLWRLTRLSTEVSRIGAGAFSARVTMTGHDELSRLAGTINSMLSALEHAGHTLRESEERYRSLFRRSPVGIFHYDTRLYITECNDRFAAILQSSQSQLVGLDMNSLRDQSVLPTLRRAIDGKDGYYEGFYQATTSSAQIWISMRTAPLFDQQGEVKGGIAIVEDITERVQAETVRQQAESSLRRLNAGLQGAAKVSHAASSILDTDRLIEQSVELIRERFELYYVGLFLVDVAQDYALLRAGTGEVGRQMLREGHKLKVGGPSMIGQCVARAEARIAPIASQEIARFNNPLLPETRSEMALPLRARGQVIGALTVQSVDESAFDETSITAMQMMADQLAIAIDNARLYTSAQAELTERVRTEEIRQQAEEALRQSEERYRTLVETAQDVIFTVAADGTLASLNPAFETLMGYSRADWQGRSFAALVHPEDLPLAQDMFKQVLQGAIPPPFVLRFLTATRGERVGELVVAPQIKDREIRGGLGIARDITDRKQAEEALRRSEEKYRALIENLNEVIFAADTRGCFTYISPRIEQVAGYTADQVIGQDFSRFIYPDDLPGLVDSFKLTLGGRLHPYEFRVLTKDKQVRYVYTSSHPVLEEGQLVGLSGVMTDITDRKQAELALWESEERFRALYEDNPSMYFTVDAQGTVLSANPFGAEQLGYTVEELVGQSVLKVFYEADRAAVTEQLKVCLQHPGQVYRWQFRKVRQDGSLLWVEEFARAVGSPGGALQVLVVCNDITERKHAEAEICRHSQRLATLNEIGRAIASTLDLDRVLALLLEQVRQFTDAEACSVALVEADTGAPSTLPPSEVAGCGLVFRQAVGGASQVVIGLRLNPGVGIAGWVAQHRQSALVFDAASDPRFSGHVDQVTGFVTHDIVCVPLVVRDRVTGVIELLNKRHGTFGEDDVTLLEAVAVEASVAIENARLFEETRRRLDELAVVSDVALAGASGQPFDETVARATDGLTRLWPEAAVGFLFVDQVNQSLRLHPYAHGVPPDIISRPRPLSQGVIGWVAREQRPIRIGDVRADPRHVDFAPGARSEIAAPLVVGQRVIGAVNVEGPRLNAFSEQDLQLLVTLARQLATIFEKVHLDAELKEHATLLEQRVQMRTAQLQAQYARLEAILHSTSDGMVVTDTKGEILEANSIAQRWLTQTLSSADATRLREVVRDLALRAQEQPEIVLELTGLDLQVSVAPILEPDDAAAVVAIHDVSQLKSLDRMRTRLVSNVSHELRTPIAAIQLYLTLLRQGRTDKRKEYLDALDQAADRLARLVEDVLRISRLDAGQLEIKSKPSGLNELTRQVVISHQELAASHGLTLEHRPSEKEHVAWVDPDRITDALINLVMNAIRYTPTGGTVVVATGREQADERAWATISVSDTGIGIPEDELPHIFERFFRGEKPREMQIPGTGLGLSIVKEIVELHRGRVTAQSRVGVGSTFTLWLPLA